MSAQTHTHMRLCSLAASQLKFVTAQETLTCCTLHANRWLFARGACRLANGPIVVHNHCVNANVALPALSIRLSDSHPSSRQDTKCSLWPLVLCFPPQCQRLLSKSCRDETDQCVGMPQKYMHARVPDTSI